MKIIRKGKNTHHSNREVYIDNSKYTSRNTYVRHEQISPSVADALAASPA